MLKLIRLEMVKNNIGKYVLYAFICILLITPFILAIDFSWGFEEADVIAGEALPITFLVEMMVCIVFIIMSAIMHGAFTINAYKNKTIDLMFSYPIKRRKILLSKIFTVLIFIFVATLVAQAIIYGAIHIGGISHATAYPMNYDFTKASTYITIAVKSAMAACMGIVGLFIGMIKKSTVAAIVSSFMLLMPLQVCLGQASLVKGILFPLMIIIVSLVFAGVIVSGAEKKDII